MFLCTNVGTRRNINRDIQAQRNGEFRQRGRFQYHNASVVRKHHGPHTLDLPFYHLLHIVDDMGVHVNVNN